MSTKDVAVVKRQFSITSPASMVSMAKVLRSHVVKYELYTPIQGKNYVHVEGWQFAGGMLGLTAIVTDMQDLSNGSETKWRATVEVSNMKDGKVVSRGFAVCSNKESKKKSFDEYAIMSMAQTRAIGKAYRNLIGWVMKLAGYEGTPSEEMQKVGETPAATPTETVIQTEEEVECHGVGRGGCEHGNSIDARTLAYSKKMYGKPLCRECQKLAKPLKK